MSFMSTLAGATDRYLVTSTDKVVGEKAGIIANHGAGAMIDKAAIEARAQAYMPDQLALGRMGGLQTEAAQTAIHSVQDTSAQVLAIESRPLDKSQVTELDALRKQLMYHESELNLVLDSAQNLAAKAGWQHPILKHQFNSLADAIWYNIKQCSLG